MMNFFRAALKKIKLFVLYWTRIVFVKNKFKVSFFTKLRMNIFGGFLADQYVLYDLKHGDKREYLSEFDWYKSRYINEPFDFAFNNKVICAEIIKQYVSTPENYFIKNKGIILDFCNGVKNSADIIEMLYQKNKLFIKPFAQGKGNGVHLLSADENRIFVDGNLYTEDMMKQFLEERQDYIICECMQQHIYAQELYEKTVNTIRLITLRNTETHEFEICFAVQRIGTAKTIPVDNGSKGGLIAKIDLDRGTLSEARCLHDLNTYFNHPDSGAKIKGMKIPGWREIKIQILNVCKKFPYMDFIAWDLLVTDKGLCVIEANTSSGVNILQLWGGQKNEILGDFFRYYDVI